MDDSAQQPTMIQQRQNRTAGNISWTNKQRGIKQVRHLRVNQGKQETSWMQTIDTDNFKLKQETGQTDRTNVLNSRKNKNKYKTETRQNP